MRDHVNFETDIVTTNPDDNLAQITDTSKEQNTHALKTMKHPA